MNEKVIIGQDPYRYVFRLIYFLIPIVIVVTVAGLAYHYSRLPPYLQVVVLLFGMLGAVFVLHMLFCMVDKRAFFWDTVVEVRKQNDEIVVRGVMSEFEWSPPMFVRMHPESIDDNSKAPVLMRIVLDGKSRFLSFSYTFENKPEVISALTGGQS